MGGTVLLLGAMIAGTTASIGEDVMRSQEASEMAQKQQEAIQLQESRAKTQAAAQQISRDKQQDAVLSQQKAMAAARGMSETSGSFQASVLGGMQSFESSSKLGNISLSMSLDNMQAEMEQIREKKSAEQMGSMFDIGKSVFGAVSDVKGIEDDPFGRGVPENLKSSEDWMRSQYNTNYNARNNVPTFGS